MRLFVKRLAAMLYDSLLIAAVLIIATMFCVIINKGSAISSSNIIFQLFLLILWFSFLWWFWCHGGQTIGLAAWQLKIVNKDSTPITKLQAIKRIFLSMLFNSCFGLGLIWALIDSKGQTLYDRICKTKLIIIKANNCKVTTQVDTKQPT